MKINQVMNVSKGEVRAKLGSVGLERVRCGWHESVTQRGMLVTYYCDGGFKKKRVK